MLNTNWKTSVGLALLWATTAQSANLINGGFEMPIVVNASQFQTIFPGAEPAGFGWTVTSGTVDTVIRGTIYGTNAAESLQWLDMDGSSAGAISQIFSTVAGLDYILRFSYSSHPLPGFTAAFPARARVQIIDTGTTAALIAPQDIAHWNSTVANLAWTSSGDVAFRALGASTTLAFRSTDLPNSSGGIFLDAVSVSPVPELPTLSTLALGLIVAALLARHSSQ